MSLIVYAETPAQRTHQVVHVQDAAVLVWVLLWVWAGLWLHDHQDAVGSLAFWLALLVAAAPIAVVLVRYVPRRVRWVRRATAGAGLRRSAADLDLFALRALVHRPLRELAKVSPDPAAAYRSGDPALVMALANLELRALGLTTQPPAPGRAGQGASTGRKAE